MGLLAPATPGSLLKDIKLVKAVDPPKKEYTGSKPKTKETKDTKDKRADDPDAERPEETAD